MSNELRPLTTSADHCFRACARKYYYRHVMLRRTVSVAHALSFGKLFHDALERWWSLNFSLMDDQRLTTALSAIADSCAEPLDQIIATELMRGYDARWRDELLLPMGVEKWFETDLINPATGHASKTWLRSGKIDAIAEYAGSLWVVEHKTVSGSIDITPGSIYWQKLQLNPQLSTYVSGAKSIGHDISGCIYDVIRKPRIKPLLATPIENRKYKKDGALYASQRAEDETLEEYRVRLHADITEHPDSYYQRGEVFYHEAEGRAADYDLWRIGRDIRACEKDGQWPRNPDSCWQYNRACDYWPVCIGETSIDDPIRYRTAETQHEELSGGESDESTSNEAIPF